MPSAFQESAELVDIRYVMRRSTLEALQINDLQKLNFYSFCLICRELGTKIVSSSTDRWRIMVWVDIVVSVAVERGFGYGLLGKGSA